MATSISSEPTIHPLMYADELCASWQGRMLRYVQHQQQLGPVVLSLIADNYDDTMPVLLRAVFPGATGVQTPLYCSAPKINKAGHVVADMIERDDSKSKDKLIFVDEMQMQAVFRVLCDRLKLTDDERRDVFRCVLHWVKSDQRLDPTMDRRDPDAKRLTVN